MQFTTSTSSSACVRALVALHPLLSARRPRLGCAQPDYTMHPVLCQVGEVGDTRCRVYLIRAIEFLPQIHHRFRYLIWTRDLSIRHYQIIFVEPPSPARCTDDRRSVVYSNLMLYAVVQALSRYYAADAIELGNHAILPCNTTSTMLSLLAMPPRRRSIRHSAIVCPGYTVCRWCRVPVAYRAEPTVDTVHLKTNMVADEPGMQ